MAIDHGRSTGGGQKSGGPADEALPRSHGLHRCKEERAADSVIGLPEVQEREDGRGGEASAGVGTQDLWQQLQEGDIVPDEAPWKEGGLLRPQGPGQHRREPRIQDLRQQPVIGVQQCYRSVVPR